MKTRTLRTAAGLLACCTALLTAAGCGNQNKPKPYDIKDYQDNATVRKEFNESLDLNKPLHDLSGAPADFKWVGQAEDAELTGIVAEESPQFPGYQGRGYVANFTGDDDSAIFTVEVPADGIYNLSFNTCTGYANSEKTNPITVDGMTAGSITTPMTAEFVEVPLEGVYLSAGTHRITAGTDWGYYYLDQLTVTPGTPISEDLYKVTDTLSDPDAFDNSKRLYKFLRDCYGKYTITGQVCDTGKFGTEMVMIENETGHYPAMLGLDMSSYTPVSVELGSKGKAVDYAKDFYLNQGGIVTMCWHWVAPKAYLPNDNAHPWYSGFYKEHTTIKLDDIAEGKDEAGKAALLADIDAICEAMEPLKEAQVPVLWRPLHEASGGWFWWGDCKASSYLWLWNQMYEKMVHEHGLHNLIWVWNGQSKDWYPGDDTVDIVGTDIYPPAHSYGSQSSAFAELASWPSSPKIVALTENGVMPDPELIQRDRAVWSWFCTWSGEFIQELHLATENYTEFSMWDKVYQSDDTLALDDLPCLWTYPMN